MAVHQAPTRASGRSLIASRPWLDTAIVASQAVVFLPFALLRYVDGDEGPYLTAAKLAMRGELPYRDFLYTQLPLLPYVWGPWSLLTGENWYAARMLSVAFAMGIGALLYRHVAVRLGRDLGIVALVLYAFSNLVFVWFTPVKTQVLSTFLLVAAYVVMERTEAPRLGRLLAGGALLGLAIDTRLILAATVPAFVWLAVRRRDRRRERLGAFAGGFALGIVPSLAFLAIDPGRFAFDNLGYHAARSDSGLVGDFEQKARVVANLLGVGTPDGGIPQYLLLLVAATISALVLWTTARRVSAAFAIAALVAVGSLFPTPTYAQYFAVSVPFLVVGTVELLAALRERLGHPESARIGRTALTVALAAYIALAVPDLVRYPRLSPDERIGAVRDVGAIVDEQTDPGDEVLTPWPGYLYGTHAIPVPGLENDFAPHEAAALTPAEARRYRLASAADVERMLAEGRTRIVVFRLWNRFPPVPDWEGGLRRGGYRLIGSVATTRIYAR